MRIRRLASLVPGSLAFVFACSGGSSNGGEAGAATTLRGGVPNGVGGSASGGTTAGGVTAHGGAGGSAIAGAPAHGGSSTPTGGSAARGGTNGGPGGSSARGGGASAGTANGGSGARGGGASAGTANGGPGGSANGGHSGGGGSPTSTCKRGIATNTAPGAEFSSAIAWWYDWAMTGSGAGSGIEFVPMAWGSGSVKTALPPGAKYLLGFNEPNFHAQANLTPQQAADLWPTLESKAKALGIPLVSPAMNYCGPASECNGTDPYQYLKDFFSACSSCEVDYVAVHWYNCDLPSLKDYLEPGGNLPGFEQFGKPIWLTEFSCDGNASVTQQEAYMRAALPYLEQNPKVFRYSWFSANPIPNAKLLDASGAATALGRVYLELPQSCR